MHFIFKLENKNISNQIFFNFILKFLLLTWLYILGKKKDISSKYIIYLIFSFKNTIYITRQALSICLVLYLGSENRYKWQIYIAYIVLDEKSDIYN